MKSSIDKQISGIATNLFAVPYLHSQLERSDRLIAKQNGVLTVLIHPFFEQLSSNQYKNMPIPEIAQLLLRTDCAPKYRRKKIRDDVTEINAKSYFLRLKNLLVHSKTLLLALGEYGPFCQTTIALLREFGFSGDILQYETIEIDSAPIPDDGTWATLATALFSLDFSKLVVAGQLNTYKKSKQKIPQGCVPKFAANMKSRVPRNKKVEVLISPVTYPNWWTKNDDHPFFKSRIK